jgi:hypothetical protein
MAAITKDNIHEVVQYHAPDTDGLAKIAALRVAAEIFARDILNHCPECADRTVALRAVREALLWANASVALNGLI